MSLRAAPIRETAVLPDGREVEIVVGVPRDDYVPPRELELVAVELRRGEEVLAAIDTVLDPDEDSEARALARELAAGLSSGDVAPTAEAIEPFADRLR